MVRRGASGGHELGPHYTKGRSLHTKGRSLHTADARIFELR